MEGYLWERRAKVGSSMFGSGKLYKKRWCVLQGQVLTIFDDLDLKSQKAKGLAKSHTKLDHMLARVRTAGANDIVKDLDHEHVFEIVPHDRPESDHEDSKDSLVFSADSENIMSMWLNSLNEACSGDTLVLTLAQHCQILGLPNPAEHALIESEVTHAYRKVVVKCHPDKPGGNERTFQIVQRSYEALLRHLERTVDFDAVHFTVVLEKTVVAGIGLKVVADDLTGEIVIRGIHPKVVIHQLDEAAGGSLLDGDILAGIGEESTLLWKFSRVRQRLNDFREPPGNLILLQFVRYVPHAEQHFQHDDAADSVWSTTLGESQTQATAGVHGTASSANAASNASASIAAASSTPLQGRLKISTLNLPPPGGSAAAHSTPRSSMSHNNNLSHEEMDLTLSPIGFTHPPAAPSGALLALQQENAELKKQLLHANEKLATEVNKSSKLNDIVNRLGDDLRGRNEALALALQKEQYYRLQVQNMLFTSYNETVNSGNASIKDQPGNQALNNSIAVVSEKILKGREVFASDQTHAYMKKADIALGANKSHTYKHAQSMAVSSVSALDPSNALLEIWDASGHTAVDRLVQLERRLQKSEKNMGFEKIAEGFHLPDTGKDKDKDKRGSIGTSGAGTIGINGINASNTELDITAASDNGSIIVHKQPVFGQNAHSGGLTSHLGTQKGAHRQSNVLGFGHHTAGHAPPGGASSRRMSSMSAHPA